MLTHEQVLNEIIANTCHNPLNWESKDDDYAPKTFKIDLHCKSALITAKRKEVIAIGFGQSEFEYELLDFKLLEE